MKRASSKQILEIFRDIVKESSRIHSPTPKKATKAKRTVKTTRTAKPVRSKARAAAE
jgi:hypothetical protein